MAATSSASLNNLLQKSTIDDHEDILKACNAQLKKSKSDTQAQQSKVVALLKLEKYGEAVSFVESTDGLQDIVGLEYAYALYKQGRLNDAAKIARNAAESRGAQHVEAQASYRLEDTKRTAELYAKIRKKKVDAEEYDLSVNQGAIDAQGQWLGHVDAANARRPSREDLEKFETAFNAACGSIARGELAQSEFLLKKAKELCKHADDLTQDQKEEELLPICVQQIFVLERQGKMAEAAAIAAEVKADNIPDMGTRKIAQNNLLLASDQPSNPFLVHKTFHSTASIPEADTPFSFQAIPLSINAKTVELQAFKFDGVASSTAKVSSKHISSSLSPEVLLSSVFNAAAHARTEVGKAAISKVLPQLQKRPTDIGLSITVAQMYVLAGDITSAVELIETLLKRLEGSIAENEQDARYNPGLVSVMVSLYRKRGQKSHIKRELAKAASYWRQKENAPASLLRAAGSSLLDSSKSEDIREASSIFDKLRQQQPTDKATMAGYIASHSEAEATSIREDANQLTLVSELIRNIDVDALERAGIPQSANALTIAQLGHSRKRTAPDSTGATKPKRIRKSRLPKDYDPAKTPDAERWLPLRDRSTYRPKGKKKGKRGGGDDRTQGGIVADDVAGSGTSTPKPGVVTGGKKKKGKGKK